MNLIKSTTKSNDEEKINRRSFLTQSFGYTTAGLSLLAFTGMLTETLAAKENKSKEKVFKELEENVKKIFPRYFSCSQPTFAVLNEQFGLKADQTVPAIYLFAGGIAGKGETCGAVIGALLAIGYKFETNNQTKTPRPGSSMMYGQMFFDKFTERFGSTRCKEVIKHQYGRYFDFNNMEDMKIFAQKGQEGKCTEVMKTAVHLAADIILENS